MKLNLNKLENHAENAHCAQNHRKQPEQLLEVDVVALHVHRRAREAVERRRKEERVAEQKHRAQQQREEPRVLRRAAVLHQKDLQHDLEDEVHERRRVQSLLGGLLDLEADHAVAEAYEDDYNAAKFIC